MRAAKAHTIYTASSGFIEHFGVTGHALRSFDSGRTFSAGEVLIREYHRFEGVSDPDDMSIVDAIEGQGGVRGTLVDAFGAYSDPTVSAFLEDVGLFQASPEDAGKPAQYHLGQGRRRIQVIVPSRP